MLMRGIMLALSIIFNAKWLCSAHPQRERGKKDRSSLGWGDDRPWKRGCALPCSTVLRCGNSDVKQIIRNQIKWHWSKSLVNKFKIWKGAQKLLLQYFFLCFVQLKQSRITVLFFFFSAELSTEKRSTFRGILYEFPIMKRPWSFRGVNERVAFKSSVMTLSQSRSDKKKAWL